MLQQSFKKIKKYVLGEVAFIVGGVETNSVEIYSPEGLCQHNLAPVPVANSGNKIKMNKN